MATPTLGGLADRVLLGVDRAHAMLRRGSILVEHLTQLVPYLVAMGRPAGAPT